MTNINDMSGIEFELFCKDLLEKNGFTVSTTATTGDGGIDLIAINNNTFFKGKYIVQCKRYTGSVGEPIIRDLYGVVMAERANKGILITTGTFTNSAITFSEGKQIELIDGDSLNQIIETGQYNDLSNNTSISIFDTDKYNYYLNQIENKQADYSVYYNFLKFIMSYIIDTKTEKTQEEWIMNLLESGENSDKLTIISEVNNINRLLILDFDSICNNIIPNIEMAMSKLATSKDCRTKIGKAFFQLLDFKYNGIKQLLHFDFAEFISSRLKYLCTSNYTRPWYNSYFILRWAESEPNLLNTCEISNIFSLLFFLNDKELIETLEKWENIKSYMEYRNSNPINYGLFSLDCPIILYPEISFIKNTKKPYISAPYYYRINLTDYFKKYFTEDIRKEQIERIRIVLDEICR